MGDYVRRGTLDFLLTKPVDAQLLVSLRHLNVQNLTHPVLG
jgi:ABC-2 type transport system permease protein